MHRGGTDAVRPRAAIGAARRGERGARNLFGVEAVRRALRRILPDGHARRRALRRRIRCRSPIGRSAEVRPGDWPRRRCAGAVSGCGGHGRLADLASARFPRRSRARRRRVPPPSRRAARRDRRCGWRAAGSAWRSRARFALRSARGASRSAPRRNRRARRYWGRCSSAAIAPRPVAGRSLAR